MYIYTIEDVYFYRRNEYSMTEFEVICRKINQIQWRFALHHQRLGFRGPKLSDPPRKLFIMYKLLVREGGHQKLYPIVCVCPRL